MWWRAIQRGLAFGTMFLILLLATASCVAQGVGEPTSGFTVPYNSYVFDFWGKPVPSPQAYSHVVTGTDLGVRVQRSERHLCRT